MFGRCQDRPHASVAIRSAPSWGCAVPGWRCAVAWRGRSVAAVAVGATYLPIGM